MEQGIALGAVVAYMSGQWHKPIVPDERVMEQLKDQNARIISPLPMDKIKFKDAQSRDDFFNKLLSLHGWTLLDRGDYLRLVSIKAADKEFFPVSLSVAHKNSKAQTGVAQQATVSANLIQANSGELRDRAGAGAKILKHKVKNSADVKLKK